MVHPPPQFPFLLRYKLLPISFGGTEIHQGLQPAEYAIFGQGKQEESIGITHLNVTILDQISNIAEDSIDNPIESARDFSPSQGKFSFDYSICLVVISAPSERDCDGVLRIIENSFRLNFEN